MLKAILIYLTSYTLEATERNPERREVSTYHQVKTITKTINMLLVVFVTDRPHRDVHRTVMGWISKLVEYFEESGLFSAFS